MKRKMARKGSPADASINRLTELGQESRYFVNQFQLESDSSAAILAATFLEEVLGELLKSYWLDDEKRAAKLLSYPGPASSFAARIDLAYMSGLISKEERQTLTGFRKLRNECAHSRIVRTFEERKLRDLCTNLKHVVCREIGGNWITDPRLRFNVVAAMLLQSLIIRGLGLERTARHRGVKSVRASIVAGRKLLPRTEPKRAKGSTRGRRRTH